MLQSFFSTEKIPLIKWNETELILDHNVSLSDLYFSTIESIYNSFSSNCQNFEFSIDYIYRLDKYQKKNFLK
ncbi:MAG: hypothetical protein E7062_09840 [Spirochaetaceae bacterium]|nr:hypothetical protein [Spirochaetaceae bacterium]